MESIGSTSGQTLAARARGDRLAAKLQLFPDALYARLT
jgi:hypothetical protein